MQCPVCSVHCAVFTVQCAVCSVYLITGRAAWFGRLRVVPAAEELPVLVEVDEVDEEFLADGAGEAGGVPDPGGAGPGGPHADVTAQDTVTALREHMSRIGGGKLQVGDASLYRI